MKEKKYFSHETAVINEGCLIEVNTKIWHFSHLMTNCVVGTKLNFLKKFHLMGGLWELSKPTFSFNYSF